MKGDKLNLTATSNGFIFMVIYLLRCEFIIEMGVKGLCKWTQTTYALGNI